MRFLAATAAVLGLLPWASAVPAPAAGPVGGQKSGKFTLYEMPTALAGPCDLCNSPDGTKIYGQDILVDKLFMLDPDTGKITEYDIPFTGAPANPDVLPVLGRGAFACAIRPGSDGKIYAANGLRNQLVKLDPTTGKVTVFTPPNPLQPVGNLQPFNDLWTGPDGMFLSQTTGNVIQYFNYKTHKFQTFQVPTPLSAPLGMKLASDGNLWYTELVGNKITRLNFTSGEQKEFVVPQPASGPAVMRAEKDRKLYFTQALANSIGSIDIDTGAFKSYLNDVPGAAPTEDTLDGQGRVWFSTWATTNELNFLNPRSGHFGHVQFPGTIGEPVSLPFQMNVAVNYGPKNAIWFTLAVVNKVGAYLLP